MVRACASAARAAARSRAARASRTGTSAAGTASADRWGTGSARNALTHWMRSRGWLSTSLTGALPTSASAASLAPTDTEPCALENSTVPESTVISVRPSSSTLMSQSVPRMAAVAAGVSRFRRLPSARLVCVHARPALSSKVVTGCAGVATPLTCSTVFWCSRSWVSSANSSAILAACRVRTKSPWASAWASRAGPQSAAEAARWSPVPCRLMISAAAPAGTVAWATSGQAAAVAATSAAKADKRNVGWGIFSAFGEGVHCATRRPSLAPGEPKLWPAPSQNPPSPQRDADTFHEESHISLQVVTLCVPRHPMEATRGSARPFPTDATGGAVLQLQK